MLNIWLLNHHASREGRHSFFAKELVNRGHRVILFASSFSHNRYKELKSYPQKTFMIKEKDNGGFERIWIKTPPYSGNNHKRILNQLAFAYRAVIAGLRIKQDRRM